jgi:transposase-like protein
LLDSVYFLTIKVGNFARFFWGNPFDHFGYFYLTVYINELQVPRDRKGYFQTRLFQPYQRREGWLEEAIIHMYKGGMSTREVAKFVESMLGSQYSPTTVSNITHIVMEDIEQWQKRPLEKRYSVIYLDGLYVKLKRDTVSSEAVYLAMGIDEKGTRQILGFYVGGHESSNG